MKNKSLSIAAGIAFLLLATIELFDFVRYFFFLSIFGLYGFYVYAIYIVFIVGSMLIGIGMIRSKPSLSSLGCGLLAFLYLVYGVTDISPNQFRFGFDYVYLFSVAALILLLVALEKEKYRKALGLAAAGAVVVWIVIYMVNGGHSTMFILTRVILMIGCIFAAFSRAEPKKFACNCKSLI